MASLTGRAGGVGAQAPGLDLATAEGERRTLDHFKDRPLLVSFLGPAHCLFCRAHVIRLIQARQEIEGLGASVVFVTYHDPELMTAKMLHDLDVPYTLLLDPTRKTYERWGLGRVGVWGMVSPALHWASVGIMLKVLRKEERSLGTSPGAPQRGGDFVLNCARTFMFANRMYSFHDRPKIEDLLAALRQCATGNAPVRLSPQAAAFRP
jgi:peroxiredoxin